MIMFSKEIGVFVCIRVLSCFLPSVNLSSSWARYPGADQKPLPFLLSIAYVSIRMLFTQNLYLYAIVYAYMYIFNNELHV